MGTGGRGFCRQRLHMRMPGCKWLWLLHRVAPNGYVTEESLGFLLQVADKRKLMQESMWVVLQMQRGGCKCEQAVGREMRGI